MKWTWLPENHPSGVWLTSGTQEEEAWLHRPNLFPESQANRVTVLGEAHEANWWLSTGKEISEAKIRHSDPHSVFWIPKLWCWNRSCPGAECPVCRKRLTWTVQDYDCQQNVSNSSPREPPRTFSHNTAAPPSDPPSPPAHPGPPAWWLSPLNSSSGVGQGGFPQGGPGALLPHFPAFLDSAPFLWSVCLLLSLIILLHGAPAQVTSSPWKPPPCSSSVTTELTTPRNL